MLAQWAVALTLDQAFADVRDTARLCCLDAANEKVPPFLTTHRDRFRLFLARL